MVNAQNPYEAPRTSTERRGVESSAGRSREFGVWEVIGLGFAAVRRQPLELVGGYFLTMLFSWFVQSIPLGLGLLGIVPEGSFASNAMSGVGLLLGYLCSAFLLVGQSRVALAAARGEVVELSQFFSGGDRVGTMFLNLLVQVIAIALGIVFFIVPGVIVALGWSLSGFFIADSDCELGESLSESWAVTRGQRGKLFLFALAAVLVAFLGLCTFFIGLLVAVPVLVVAYAVIYVRLTGNTEPPALRA